MSSSSRNLSKGPALAPDPPRWWAVAAALVLATLVQTTFGSSLALRGATVSWLLLVAVWYGLATGSLGGLVVGLIAGSCDDAFAADTSPAWTFATGLAGLAAGRAAGTFLATSRAWLAPLVAALSLVRSAAFAVAMQVEGKPAALPAVGLHVAVWQAVLNAVVAVTLVAVVPALRARHVARG